ncbi:TadE family protein [Novosphingobium sp.]|uniref:TadE family protein n=1 Tax=Novosphingobium sp. TaxID=1874826 RepID=UPI001EB950EB|nr:TadE family protein [Novosphingobium sp.]MBK9011688.1 pilus assembly protein [Novosphingobium sp.]
MTLRPLSSLGRESEGATIVEFALVLPVLMVTLMGLFDLAYNMYTQQLLQGAIQNAARSSTIEGASGSEAAIDAIVTEAVHAIAPTATMQFERRAYASFADVARPEGLYRRQRQWRLRQRRTVRGRQRQRQLGRGPRCGRFWRRA